MKFNAIKENNAGVSDTYSLSRNELQHAYEYARAKIALKYGMRKMSAKSVKMYIGLDQDESIIYHVINGTASSKHVLEELLKMIFHIDPDLLPPKVVQELELEGLTDDLDNEFPHPNFINSANINDKGE